VGYAAVGYSGTTVIGAVAMVVIAVLVWRFLPETTDTDGVAGPATPTETETASPSD
jgi:hypothetical protein